MIFSTANALMGIFFATAITYIVMYTGFLPEAYLPVHAVMALTVLWGLSRRNV